MMGTGEWIRTYLDTEPIAPFVVNVCQVLGDIECTDNRQNNDNTPTPSSANNDRIRPIQSDEPVQSVRDLPRDVLEMQANASLRVCLQSLLLNALQ